ncbi:MAG: ABC transporter substrate-binding protein [Betaproteobacteria bacterium]
MNARLLFALGLVAVLAGSPALAEKRYDPGASDTEIKIGQTMPYSGPASAYGTWGKSEAAYFAKVNAEGGINGRKIEFLSLDDGYSPPRTVEQTRRLVEHDKILLLFSSLGTATNSSVHKYLNAKKVPQLFVASADGKFSDPERYPWTMGWVPTQQTETAAYAQYILKIRPDGRIAVLFQNDDFGKDYLKWFKNALGEAASRLIVATASYETTDPTVDSQVVTLQASGADVFVNLSTPKFAAQAIRRVHDIGWRPLHILVGASRSVSAVLQPAGLEKSVGLVTGAYLKDPTDPQWKGDPAVKEWLAWMDKYYPEGDRADFYNAAGYTFAQTLVLVLKQCGDNLTRENVMRQAANLHDATLPLLLPGIRINTSPTDFRPLKQMQLQRFDGVRWVLFGEVIGR